MEQSKERGRHYAIVWDASTNAYYILETARDEWRGPYTSRIEAEFALTRVSRPPSSARVA